MRIGIDLGGSKIAGVVLDADGVERASIRRPTPTGDYAGTIAAIGEVIRDLERVAGPASAAVGIGMPGALSRVTGLVKNANSTWLIGRAFDRDLQAALGRPVSLANDADCFALSEAADGAAAGASVVFGVILGTGVGGGIVAAGRLLNGPNAITGEWGHNPLPWPEAGEHPGPFCYCGRRGCIEAFLSGPGFARDYQAAARRELAPATVADAAARGDRQARAALARYVHRLARALASVINIVDPEVIVLGGGMSNLDVIYRRVPLLWHRWVFSDRTVTRLRRARFGDASGVRGAARLTPEASGHAVAQQSG